MIKFIRGKGYFGMLFVYKTHKAGIGSDLKDVATGNPEDFT
jgi:hypothetical protein